VKPSLRSLKKDQEIWAIVEEPIAHDELIINFTGDLIRVQNKTERSFRAGQRVLLKVQSLSPLKLKLVFKSKSSRSSRQIDLSI
jgi:hypothetical protein